MFAIYQRDVTGSEIGDLLGNDATPFTRRLAEAVASRSGDLDQVIDRYSQGWSVDRIAPLERAILRVAILEITEPDAVEAGTPIPPEGAIDEAVETAKQFCGAEAPGFVNGILGSVIHESRTS